MAITRWYCKCIKLLFVLCCMTVCLESSAFAANFVVIANKKVVEDTLAKGELRSIYLGEKVKWENGKYIKFAVLEDERVYKDFLQRAVGKTPVQFIQHWMGIITTGKGSMPKTFSETDEIIDYVARQPYSVGFIPDGHKTDSVKIITVK